MCPRSWLTYWTHPRKTNSDRAWDEFLSAYGHLFLRTAKYTHRGPDASMDAYAYVLERVRENGFQRLRSSLGGMELPYPDGWSSLPGGCARIFEGSGTAVSGPPPQRSIGRPAGGWSTKSGIRGTPLSFLPQAAQVLSGSCEGKNIGGRWRMS